MSHVFLGPNGEVRQGPQSGHPRYPYFYASLVTTAPARQRARGEPALSHEPWAPAPPAPQR